MVDFTTISPHLSVKISPKAKRLALRLDSRTRKVNLVIPQRASLKKAYEFAEAYQDWINDKIDGLPCPVPFHNSTVLPLMGKEYVLKIVKGDTKITKFELTPTELIVTTPLEDISPRISRYLRKMAHDELSKLAHQKASLLQKKLSKFVVRDMKSRWGSCSIDGRMTLSWRLIFAPMSAIDYVVSHEAAHLIHPDHGKNFWALCEKISDDFATGHSWMQKKGSSLGRYGEAS